MSPDACTPQNETDCRHRMYALPDEILGQRSYCIIGRPNTTHRDTKTQHRLWSKITCHFMPSSWRVKTFHRNQQVPVTCIDDVHALSMAAVDLFSYECDATNGQDFFFFFFIQNGESSRQVYCTVTHCHFENDKHEALRRCSKHAKNKWRHIYGRTFAAA